MKILFSNLTDKSKRILDRNGNSVPFTKRKKNKTDENISKKIKKTRHLKKNCYFSHSELEFKSKKSRDKSSSSRIKEEFINNFSEIAMTA